RILPGETLGMLLSYVRGGRRVAEAIQPNNFNSTPSGHQAQWVRILDQLKGEIGDDAFHNWLGPVSLESVDSGQVILAAPTRFLRDWVRTHYADRLLALWRMENEKMKRLSIIVAAQS